MDYGWLKIFGAVAGIGGVAFGAVVLVFKEVIRKQIFPTLTKQHAYQLLNKIITLTFVIGVVGIVAYVILNWPKETAGVGNTSNSTNDIKNHNSSESRIFPPSTNAVSNETNEKVSSNPKRGTAASEVKDIPPSSIIPQPGNTSRQKLISAAKAKTLLSERKYTEAIAECDRILSIDPNNADAVSVKRVARKNLEILKP